MTGTIAFVIVCAAGCGGPKGGGGETAHATPAKLCVDANAPGGTSLQLTREDQPGLVQDGDDKIPDLTLRFGAQYAELPEDSVLERRDGELWLVDADCDGARDLVLTRSCAMEGDEAPKVSGDAYLHQSDGTFVK